eukprot:gnl/MRDRNA2_/MRDRNA2_102993_c0_seq1.p1 gnl/MRDRNA2_/MRDRNA2_102993_c0~~gnl/MRDRNA2_/MRDRNA2_102993_c0_seq1.p1  ORF type:complete len:520 (-),score=132.02 gnl/MRDRNA2_/MRDRNA2_102993_c0_seq1:58-1617(-)
MEASNGESVPQAQQEESEETPVTLNGIENHEEKQDEKQDEKPDERPVCLVIGTGNIGGEVAKQLRESGDWNVKCGSRNGDVKIDITDRSSILSLDEQIPGGLDHVVIATGASTFGALASFTTETWQSNLQTKLVAVTNFVLMLVHKETAVLRDGGGITITSGQAATKINKMWPGLATNNAALDAFVRNGGIDLPRKIRLNAVSPALVTETAVAAGLPTEGTVAAAAVAPAYLSCIAGKMTGEVTAVGDQVKFQKSHSVQKAQEKPPTPQGGGYTWKKPDISGGSDQMQKAHASKEAAVAAKKNFGTVDNKSLAVGGAGAGGGLGLNAPGFGPKVNHFSGGGRTSVKSIEVDGAIPAAWSQVLDDKDNTAWIFCEYSADGKRLDLKSKGEGGLKSFKTELGQSIAWGGFRCNAIDKRGGVECKRPKFIFVQYKPESTSAIKKAKQGSHKGAVKDALAGAHLDLLVENDDDLEEQQLIQKLQAATGAHKPNGYEFEDGVFVEADFYGLGIGKNCKGETSKN